MSMGGAVPPRGVLATCAKASIISISVVLEPYIRIWRERGEFAGTATACKSRAQAGGQAHRTTGLAHAGDEQLGAHQKFLAAARFLQHLERGAAQFAAARSRRRSSRRAAPASDSRCVQRRTTQLTPRSSRKALCSWPEQAQQLGPAALEEPQPVGVIDDAVRRRCPRNRPVTAGMCRPPSIRPEVGALTPRPPRHLRRRPARRPAGRAAASAPSGIVLPRWR